MHYIIYKTTNMINSKYYIGKHKTRNINDGYMGSGKLLLRAIKKYGIENFSREILHFCSNEEEMNAMESDLVVINENTYNLCPGGHGGFGYINSNPDKFLTERRINALKAIRKYGSAAMQAKLKNDPDFKAKMDAHRTAALLKYMDKYPHSAFAGKNHTIETKQQMSKSHAGKHQAEKNSQYGTMWITNGVNNRKINKYTGTILDGWYKGRTYKK